MGVLITGSFSTQNIFDMAMRELGWHPGQDVQIDYRLTNGDEDSSRADARELISLNPNVLFAVTNTSMAALYVEETNIPTVFAMVSDPVGMGCTMSTVLRNPAVTSPALQGLNLHWGANGFRS